MRSYSVATLLVFSVSATAALAQEPSTQDRQAWRTLANRRFVTGEVKPALDALNQVGEPLVAGVKVEGLVRTDRKVVTDYLGVAPGELFTAERLTRLERRLDELPVMSYGSVRYDAVGNSATIRPIVYERDCLPNGLIDWLSVGIRVAFQHEVRVDVSDPLGWGEVWSPSYRFDPDRTEGSLRLAVPAPGRLPGILHVHALAERQLFGGPVTDILYREHRFSAGVSLSDWTTSWLRLEGGPSFDRIDGTNYLALAGSIGLRGMRDRIALILTYDRWIGSATATTFDTTELVGAFRSTERIDVPFLTMTAGIADAGGAAPVLVWPAAGSGQGQGILLRAHRFDRRELDGDEMFGRRVLFGSLEYERPVLTPYGNIGIAGFVDTAQALSRLNATDSRLQTDIGAGVRVTTSRSGSRVRVDYAYGLADGRHQLSTAYVIPWGRR